MGDVDIQSWAEVPSIAHFCSLFREAFGLFEFDMEQLEESLLLLGSEEEGGLVTKLILKLLVGCLPMYKKYIKMDNYSKYLRQFFQTKLEEAEEDRLENYFDNPFEDYEDKDFPQLPLKEKVRVLHLLCEYRLEGPDVGDKVKNLDAASLRVEPLGVDSEGSTLWYFYGTRLYKETCVDKENGKLDKKRRKKHKKEKKKKRKKSKDTDTDSSEEGDSSQWSVACLTEEDWKGLVVKYKESRKKEDRRLYRLLNDSFLPEIKEMFKEKEKERKRREQEMFNMKRSSSRIEILKKTQEEKDRQLALQLAQKFQSLEANIGRGRKRKTVDGATGAALTSEEEELAKEREERAQQRQMMKEMRARKAAEKLVESKFKDDVVVQRQKLKELEARKRLGPPGGTAADTDEPVGGGHRQRKKQKRLDSASTPDTNNTRTTTTTSKSSPKYSTSPLEEEDPSPTSSRDPTPDYSDDDDDVYRPPKEQKPPRSIFSNALIRAGSKSTKDSTLEKHRQHGGQKEGAASGGAGAESKSADNSHKPPPIVRKTAGLLLQSAGKGLLNCQPKRDEFSELLKPKQPTISFGLYGGHLSVDESSVLGTSSLEIEDSPFMSLLSKDKSQESTKKVFTNWGGDFFKKNLDFRANTNKILEKMQLTKTQEAASNNDNNSDMDHSDARMSCL